MTCDTSRPCKRCVQRGLQDTCEDAPRKKKKYLADVPSSMIKAQSVDERNISGHPQQQQQQLPPPLGGGQGQYANHHLHQATMFQHSASVPAYVNDRPNALYRSMSQLGLVKQESPGSLFSDQQYNVDNYQQSRSGSGDSQWQQAQNQQPLPQQLQQGPQRQRKPTNFLSSAADLEYSQLSNILQDNFMGLNPNHLATSTEGTPGSVNISPVLSPHGMLHKPVNSPSSLGTNTYSVTTTDANTRQPPSPQKAQLYQESEYPRCDGRINQYFLSSSGERSSFPDVIQAIEAMRDSDPSVFYERNQKLALSFTIGTYDENGFVTVA